MPLKSGISTRPDEGARCFLLIQAFHVQSQSGPVQRISVSIALQMRNRPAFTPYQNTQRNVGHNKNKTQIIVETSMVKIECDPEGGFSVVEGYEEFLELMDKKGTVEVSDTSTGRHYFAHEVGNEIYLLNQASQDALTTMANLLIQNIIKKSWS